MGGQNNRVYFSHLNYRKPLIQCHGLTFSPFWSKGVSVSSSWGLIHALYAQPKAQIHLQGYYSKPIGIARGTRQGCPLSPLIFAIETLAITIRQNPNIKGVSCGDQNHKCGLFADDILLFLTSPLTSLPNLCQVLEEFSKISGLQVNFSKLQALNVSLLSTTVSLL